MPTGYELWGTISKEGVRSTRLYQSVWESQEREARQRTVRRGEIHQHIASFEAESWDAAKDHSQGLCSEWREARNG